MLYLKEIHFSKLSFQKGEMQKTLFKNSKDNVEQRE